MGVHSGWVPEKAWHSTIRLADEAHGRWSAATTMLCQGLLPAVATLHGMGFIDLDSLVASVWLELYSWPAAHWAMIEALVAALAFFGWISLFFILNEIPSVKPFRMVVRAESHPLNAHCLTLGSYSRVYASLPLYLGGVFALHCVKAAGKVPEDPPTAFRLFTELCLGIVAYDFIFYWIHLAMHKFPNSWHKHETHHELKVHPVCGTSFLGVELVVNHSLEDALMQVCCPTETPLKKHMRHAFVRVAGQPHPKPP